jgi:hypothetical protein
MRISLLIRLSIFSCLAFIVFSCGKKTEQIDDYDFQKERLTELLIPLQPGKYITYRVDSTVFTNFGRTTEVHKYLVKHVVDAQVTDNLDRPSFRVYRYITDSASTQPWQASGSYLITPLDDRIELIENNLRVIKLHTPVRDGNKWNGNTYLGNDPYGSFYGFSNDDNMADWEFYFDRGLQSSLTIQGKTYTDAYTVQENDESDPVTGPSDYGSVSFAKEIYSKNIGLVYRELTLWEQQPNPVGNPPNVTYDPYKIGFGIKMWMVAHN